MSWDLIFQHLFIVLAASLLSIAVGLPLGIWAYVSKTARPVILRIVDLLQTIPSLALLGIIMVVLDPGKLTVITGITLYSLLPIVRNTCLGLQEVDPGVKEAARGMGMSKPYRVLMVEFPLAFPTVFTGIRIAVVNAIGTAVFAAFVGGGGLGGDDGLHLLGEVHLPLRGGIGIVGQLLLVNSLIENAVGHAILAVDGCRLGDGVADTENVAFVDEPLAVLVNPKHGAAESESSPIGAELLHLMADAVVFQVAYAVELLGAGGDSHVDAVAEVARRADALEGGQIEAPFGHAAVVVGEAARGHDDGFGLVLHQVAEGVDGVHAVDGAVLVIAEFQGAVVETDVRRRIAQLLLHGIT